MKKSGRRRQQLSSLLADYGRLLADMTRLLQELPQAPTADQRRDLELLEEIRLEGTVQYAVLRGKALKLLGDDNERNRFRRLCSALQGLLDDIARIGTMLVELNLGDIPPSLVANLRVLEDMAASIAESLEKMGDASRPDQTAWAAVNTPVPMVPLPRPELHPILGVPGDRAQLHRVTNFLDAVENTADGLHAFSKSLGKLCTLAS